MASDREPAKGRSTALAGCCTLAAHGLREWKRRGFLSAKKWNKTLPAVRQRTAHSFFNAAAQLPYGGGARILPCGVPDERDPAWHTAHRTPCGYPCRRSRPDKRLSCGSLSAFVGQERRSAFAERPGTPGSAARLRYRGLCQRQRHPPCDTKTGWQYSAGGYIPGKRSGAPSQKPWDRFYLYGHPLWRSLTGTIPAASGAAVRCNAV